MWESTGACLISLRANAAQLRRQCSPRSASSRRWRSYACMLGRIAGWQLPCPWSARCEGCRALDTPSSCSPLPCKHACAHARPRILTHADTLLVRLQEGHARGQAQRAERPGQRARDAGGLKRAAGPGEQLFVSCMRAKVCVYGREHVCVRACLQLLVRVCVCAPWLHCNAMNAGVLGLLLRLGCGLQLTRSTSGARCASEL